MKQPVPNLFAAYSRSSAFRVDLTQNMVQILMAMHHEEKTLGPDPGFMKRVTSPDWIELGSHFLVGHSALIRRGLIEAFQSKHLNTRGVPHRAWRLTEAGKALIPLLMIAGFEVPKPARRRSQVI